MSSPYDEPRLEDMLVDSIVRAVIEADGVDPSKLEAELRQTAVLVRAMRRTPKSRQGPDVPIGPIDEPNTDDPP